VDFPRCPSHLNFVFKCSNKIETPFFGKQVRRSRTCFPKNGVLFLAFAAGLVHARKGVSKPFNVGKRLLGFGTGRFAAGAGGGKDLVRVGNAFGIKHISHPEHGFQIRLVE